MKFLELAGSYKKGPDWTNIRDRQGGRGFISHDLRILPIPNLEDESFDGVYSEHFIEHMSREEGINIFKEMYRIMKPGAVIRTVWPSMDVIDRMQSEEDLSNDQFVELYTRCIIGPEQCFRDPYYNQFGGFEAISKMRKQDKVALRVLHQEGEHKHVWRAQELITALTELGFKEAQVMPYQSSRFEHFNRIDNPQEMRPLHSVVVEAIK